MFLPRYSSKLSISLLILLIPQIQARFLSLPLTSGLLNKTYHFFADNFHTVQDKHLYRSAQLSPDRLKYYIKHHDIKSVINLRGKHPNRSWWQKEAKLLSSLNVELHNIGMSAKTLPSRENLKTLLGLYKTLPRPILIHCHGGADRTGEAAALWKIEQQKTSRKRALKQLSLSFRHIKSYYPAKRFLIKIWQGQTWLENDYDPNRYPLFSPHQPIHPNLSITAL